ncbi:mycofactocin precursor [Actinomadura sp. GC306]|nr:mycofactocin precursor MftA [Actinomadura sp. GC306]TDC68045.1 mycofactocin precursor [Actinomadura sp. GC306]
MDTNAPEQQTADPVGDAAREADVAEALIEEVSIDGMCGVY